VTSSASLTSADHGWSHHVPASLIDRLTAAVTASGQPRATAAPFTGDSVFTYPMSTEADVDEAFTRARVAQRAWAARPVAEHPPLWRDPTEQPVGDLGLWRPRGLAGD
jgi:aldehyde dehydrogenase (NAD+)/succinate-semialdehyde dehydrogenase/glutarate-semialdehyde dehydrogenase